MLFKSHLHVALFYIMLVGFKKCFDLKIALA